MKRFAILVAACALLVSQPAAASTASQRVQILKYYQCLAQSIFYPGLLCHL